MDLITIVVPVYNKSKYLDSTMNQIIEQTYKNLQIICIDDNSSDDSLVKLNMFAKNDLRITIVHNAERMGAANSRNKGLELCEGEYVIFLDADDEYTNDMIEAAYMEMKKYDAEVVVIPYERINRCKLTEVKNKIYFNNEKEDCFCLKSCGSEVIYRSSVLVWNKLYRTEYILKHKIRFQDLSSSNDVFFGVMSLCMANRVVVLKEEKSYIKHVLGIQNQISNKRKSINAYLAWKQVYDVMVQNNIWEYFKDEILNLITINIKEELRKCNDEDINKDVFNRMQNDFYKDFNVRQDFSNIHDKKIKDELNRIKELSYEEYMTRLSFYRLLKKYCSNEVLEVINKAKEQGEIIVWGAGFRSWEFINYLEENGIEVRYVVDRDEKKHTKINDINIEICSWEKIKEVASCVCILREKYYDEICNEIGDSDDKITILNVEKYAPFYVEF